MSALESEGFDADLQSGLHSVPKPDEVDYRSGWRCWLTTTTGIVLMLLFIQFVTGLLLGFYYVPSVDHAHTTVSFIEKIVPGGSWIRALHHHGSQWLPLFLLLHVVQLYWRGVYRSRKVWWVGAVIMLALAMAAGATGYSLPWDARAFFSTRVAEGIVSGLPLVGRSARALILGGNELSTITLSRFFALHVFVTPFLIILVVVWLLFYSRTRRETLRTDEVTPRGNHLARQAFAAVLAFVALAICAYRYPAPLGPAVALAGSEYLPRPGLQFLWLYQTLKYVPGALGSIVGIGLPGFFFLMLAVLPWLKVGPLRRLSPEPQRLIGGVILAGSILLVASMTLLSYAGDRRDPRAKQQLARQAEEEKKFRQEPFVPVLMSDTGVPAASSTPSRGSQAPAAYMKFCANCHGENGEGAQQGKLKFPPLLGVADKPRRTTDDIVGLLNDPESYGLEPPMRSFATKLTDVEKREIAEWVVKLKK